jgi:hypothetical protein
MADPAPLPDIPAQTAAEELRARYNWKKVTKAQRWDPEEGDELVGYYGGQTVQNGTFGEYTVIILHVPQGGSYMLTGMKLVQLVDVSPAQVGDPMIVKWLGHKKTGGGHQMKDYEVKVADGERVPEDAMPEVKK